MNIEIKNEEGKGIMIVVHQVEPLSKTFQIFFGRGEDGCWQSRRGEKGSFSNLPSDLRRGVEKVFSQDFCSYQVMETDIMRKREEVISGGGRILLFKKEE